MTDKEQIIVHGVDVSECTFHYQNKEGKHKCFKCDVVTICDGACSYGAIYLKEQLARKTQECEKMKYYLNKIRQNELSSLDIEWDEYITECRCTDYSNIITYVEYGLGERDD